jgi:hypothetical protein
VSPPATTKKAGGARHINILKTETYEGGKNQLANIPALWEYFDFCI